MVDACVFNVVFLLECDLKVHLLVTIIEHFKNIKEHLLTCSFLCALYH